MERFNLNCLSLTSIRKQSVVSIFCLFVSFVCWLTVFVNHTIAAMMLQCICILIANKLACELVHGLLYL